METIIGISSIAIIVFGAWLMNREVKRQAKLDKARHQEVIDGLMSSQATRIRVAIATSQTAQEVERQERQVDAFESCYGMNDKALFEVADLRWWIDYKYTKLLKEQLPGVQVEEQYNDHMK